MKFKHTVLSGLMAEIPPIVCSSEMLEQRLAPLYTRLKLPIGRLELMTGIQERRFWPHAIRPSVISAAAGRSAMNAAGIGPNEIELLIHSSVCRDRLEPSTAAYVHGLLGLGQHTQILDVSNACLGFLNGVVLSASMVEAGLIRCALVCSGEDGLPLVERTIRLLNEDPTFSRESIKPYFANLTIGSGGAAVMVCRDDIAKAGSIRLLGAVTETDSSANGLCEGDSAFSELDMRTNSEALLKAGISLARNCWGNFKKEMDWNEETPQRIVTHQVGKRHTSMLFEQLGLNPELDFHSFPQFGNIGSASIPVTLALGLSKGHIKAKERIALLGIGSGLASMMLAIES